jgi:hypothetical protein
MVLDRELGVLKINWDKIRRVEFLPTPKNLDQVFGSPLYGTVTGARKETHTGLSFGIMMNGLLPTF